MLSHAYGPQLWGYRDILQADSVNEAHFAIDGQLRIK